MEENIRLPRFQKASSPAIQISVGEERHSFLCKASKWPFVLGLGCAVLTRAAHVVCMSQWKRKVALVKWMGLWLLENHVRMAQCWGWNPHQEKNKEGTILFHPLGGRTLDVQKCTLGVGTTTCKFYPWNLTEVKGREALFRWPGRLSSKSASCAQYDWPTFRFKGIITAEFRTLLDFFFFFKREQETVIEPLREKSSLFRMFHFNPFLRI